jgi:Zn-dependent protease with chaperone function
MGIQLFQYLIYLFVFIFISINLTYAYYRSMSIRITPWNFPEVYEMIDTYCKKLGMETPEAYLMNSNGVMNAMSTFIVRKQYLEIDVDLFEVAYREHHDMDTLGFVIAHELSHIYYRHAHFGVYMSTCISYSIPVIGSALSRAREYSCDRLAQRITDNYGVDAMMALIAGKHLYKQVDMEDYIMQAQHAKNGFFITLYNLTSSHPIMSKRVLALLEGKGSGKLF